MISSTWLLALLILAIGINAENQLPKNRELEVSSDMADKRNVLGFNSFVGIGTENPVISQYFEHNFGRSSTLVGDLDTAKWGIQCIDTTDKHINSCTIDDGAKDEEDYYFSNRFLYKDAHVAVRLVADETLDINTDNRLPIRLITSDYHWPLNKLGVVGLTPNGDFANYISNLYKGDVELLFGYNVADANANNDDLKFNNHVVVNPAYLDNVTFASFTYKKGAEYWSQIADVSIDKIDDMKFPKTNVCFSSISNEILILVDSEVMCDRVRAKVCGGKVGKDCTGDLYNEAKDVPTLRLKFGDKEFYFEGKEYIYVDNNVVKCRFGDLSDLRSEQVCPEETEIAVGRLFFSKYYPSMKFQGETQTLSFLTSYNFNPDPTPTPPNPDSKFSFWYILLIVALIIIVGLLVFFFLKRRNADTTEEHYRDL